MSGWTCRQINSASAAKHSNGYERWVFGRVSNGETRPRAEQNQRFVGGFIEQDVAGRPLLAANMHDLPLWQGLPEPRYRPVLIDRSQTTDATVRLSTPLFAQSVNTATLEPSSDTALLSGSVAGGDVPKVIIAIIDDAIPFAHASLRNAQGTRLKHFWALSGVADASSQQPIGRALSKTEIDGLWDQHKGLEADIYSAFGSAEPDRPLSRHTSHGAFCMDLAAGTMPGEGGIEQAAVIAVQLRNAGGVDTSGFGRDFEVLMGLHFLFEAADDIARAHAAADGSLPLIPLVITCSYGRSGGPHDGSSLLERGIDELIQARRNQGKSTSMFLPAGNHALSRLHARIEDRHFTNSTTGDLYVDLTWRIQPSDRTPNYLELWFEHPEGDPLGRFFERFQIQLQPPGCPNLRFPVIRNDDPRKMVYYDLGNEDDNRPPPAQVSIEVKRGGRLRLLVATAPSEILDVDEPPSPAGDWQLRIVSYADTLQSPVLVYVQRDVNPYGEEISARQSYLVDDDYWLFGEDGRMASGADVQAPTTFISRQGTTNGMGTGTTTYMVGSYTHFEEKTAPYSGLASGTEHERVACEAPSDRSLNRLGIIAAGTAWQQTGTLSGTSAASPLAARALALAYLEDRADALIAQLENAALIPRLPDHRPRKAAS